MNATIDVTETVTMTVYAGRCRGGPYNTKNMIHGTTSHEVAIEYGKAVPGMVAPSVKHPDIKFGTYTFDETRQEWDWTDPETPEAVHN